MISMISQYVSHSSPWSHPKGAGAGDDPRRAAQRPQHLGQNGEVTGKNCQIAPKYTGKSGDFFSKMGKYGKVKRTRKISCDFFMIFMRNMELMQNLDMSEQNTTSAMTIEIDPTKIGSATILPFWCGFYYQKKLAFTNNHWRCWGNGTKKNWSMISRQQFHLLWCLYNFMTSRESVIIKSYHNTLGIY